MSCSIQYEGLLLLNLTFSENEHKKDFVIYFKPDEGQQRKLVFCEWIQTSDKYECSIFESGLTCSFPHAENILITLPRSLQDQPGKFRCQTLGQNITDLRWCSWNPSETKTTLRAVQTSFFPGNVSSSTSNSKMSGKGSSHPADITGVVAGILLPILVIIIILSGVCVWKFKKRKSKRDAAYSSKSKTTEEVFESMGSFIEGRKSLQTKNSEGCKMDLTSHQLKDTKIQRSPLLSSDSPNGACRYHKVGEAARGVDASLITEVFNVPLLDSESSVEADRLRGLAVKAHESGAEGRWFASRPSHT